MRKPYSLKQNYLIRLGSTGIYVSVFSILSLFFVITADLSVYSLIILLSILAHESGHIFALKLCKEKPKKIFIYPFGVDMRCNLSALSYEKELFVMLSGSAVNLIICASSFLVCTFAYSRECLFVSFCNAFYAFTNLIPITSLDGGRALYAFLCSRFSEEKAFFICKHVSNASYALLSVAFIVVIILTKANFSMIITLCFFAMGTFLASHLLK